MVTQHEVMLTADANPDQVARTIDQRLRAGPVATTTRRKGAFQASTLSDLVDLIGFAHWLGFACVGLVLALVATTTVMSVQDRIKEYAILQTIGVRPFRAWRLVQAESIFAVRDWRFGGNGIGVACPCSRRIRDRRRRCDYRVSPIDEFAIIRRVGVAGPGSTIGHCPGNTSGKRANRQSAQSAVTNVWKSPYEVPTGC